MIRALIVVVVAATLGLCSLAQVSTTSTIAPSPSYVLATFNNTWQNLFIEFSNDLIFWHLPSPATAYPLTHLVRDPSIMKYNGRYYLIHTYAVAVGPLHQFMIASSADLKTWTTPTLIDGNQGGLTIQNLWAPEWFIDPNGSGLSSVHVFFAVDLTGAQNDFQIYEMHATASDFDTNAASWSNPVLITVTGQTNIIDPFIVYRSDTSTYYMWFNGFGTAAKYASSSTLTGTYGSTVTDPGGWGSGMEGTCLRQIIAGSPGTWRVWFDFDGGSLTPGQINYADSTDGWSTWTALTPIYTPGQAKQGTIIVY